MAVLLAAAVFECFATVTTQVKSLRAHSPWQNDPYDAVVTFTMFFVPLICGLCLVRVQLFRRQMPLAIQRVRDLLRATRMVLALIVVTLAADWTSVVLQADRSTWTMPTLLAIGMLGLTSAVAVGAGIALHFVPRQRSLTGRDMPTPSLDWAGDMVAVADQWSLQSGPFSRIGAPVSRWLRTGLLDGGWGVRRHPLMWANSMAVAFGTQLAASAAVEDGLSPVLLLFVAVGACGMFAFVVMGGSFLGIVRTTTPSTGMRRRLIDAVTLMCASVPVALAFRDSLWWAISSPSGQAGLGPLATLLAAVACTIFFAVLAAETGLGFHSRR